MFFLDNEDELKNTIFIFGVIVVVLSGMALPIVEFIITILFAYWTVNITTLSNIFLSFVYKALVMLLLWVLLFGIVALIAKFDRRGEDREWHLKLYAGCVGLAFGPVLAMNILIPILEQLATMTFLVNYNMSDYTNLTNLGSFIGLFYQNMLVAPKVVMLIGFPLFIGLEAYMIQDVYEIDYLKGLVMVIPIAMIAFIFSGPLIDLIFSPILGVF
ncbi:MAG: hypothetical protein ACTSRW_06335 [Candidatus Helarchaeota archaeon]